MKRNMADFHFSLYAYRHFQLVFQLIFICLSIDGMREIDWNCKNICWVLNYQHFGSRLISCVQYVFTKLLRLSICFSRVVANHILPNCNRVQHWSRSWMTILSLSIHFEIQVSSLDLSSNVWNHGSLSSFSWSEWFDCWLSLCV